MTAVPDVIAAMDSALYEGSIPLSLAVQWEREGAAGWASCVDPGPLLRILVGVDARLGARVAAACAGTARDRLDANDAAIATAALDAADAWGRGESDGSACYQAGRAATKRANDLAASDAYGAGAPYAAAHAAYVAHAAIKNARTGASDHAALAARSAASASYEAEPDAEALRRIADVVRSMSGCPRL